MSHRTHRFDAWHLLAEPTFGAILAHAEGEALAELARRGQAPPFAAAGDDTIEVAHPRLLAALVALKRQEELLAGPKGSYASSRWQKRSFRLPQLYAFELAGTEARGKYLDALAAVENSA